MDVTYRAVIHTIKIIDLIYDECISLIELQFEYNRVGWDVL